jgi:hypothetical protein
MKSYLAAPNGASVRATSTCRRGNTSNRRVRIAALFLVGCAAATNARADWLLGAFTGAAHTASNTLTVNAPGTTVTIRSVDYRGEAWISPIYYGFRFGWAPSNRRFGVEGEWIHAKARGITGSIVLSRFDQSHGLNFVLISAVYRYPVARQRVTLLARAGGGFTLPHVEGTFFGSETESYQYGGLAWHGGAGLEVRLPVGLVLLADARITRTAEELDVAGATIDGTFVTSHVDFGIGWRLGR